LYYFTLKSRFLQVNVQKVNLGHFYFINKLAKTATQKPTTRISVAFALGQKLQKKPFETDLNFKNNLILISK